MFEIFEVFVVRLSRVARERELKATGEGVSQLSSAAHSWPGIDGILNRFGSGSIGTGSVGFPKSVATANQGHSLPVIHVHPGEGIPDVRNTEFGFRVAQKALRVH